MLNLVLTAGHGCSVSVPFSPLSHQARSKKLAICRSLAGVGSCLLEPATFAYAGSLKRRLHTMLLTRVAVIPADPDLDHKVAWQEQAGQQMRAIHAPYWGRPILCRGSSSARRCSTGGSLPTCAWIVTAIYLLCRERAEKRRLQRQLNKERRGAMRELRKDAVFISEERDREKLQAAAERAQVGLACCGGHHAVQLSRVRWLQDCCSRWAAALFKVFAAKAGCCCQAARGPGAFILPELCSSGVQHNLQLAHRPPSMQPAKIMLC